MLQTQTKNYRILREMNQSFSEMILQLIIQYRMNNPEIIHKQETLSKLYECNNNLSGKCHSLDQDQGNEELGKNIEGVGGREEI